MLFTANQGYTTATDFADYLVKNKILSTDPTMKAQEIDAINFVVSDLLLMLDSDNQFTQIADTLTFITDNESNLDLDENGLSPWEKRHKKPFEGKEFPLGCGVFFLPVSTKAQGNHNKAAPNAGFGVFLGWRQARVLAVKMHASYRLSFKRMSE